MRGGHPPEELFFTSLAYSEKLRETLALKSGGYRFSGTTLLWLYASIQAQKRLFSRPRGLVRNSDLIVTYKTNGCRFPKDHTHCQWLEVVAVEFILPPS